MKSSRPFSIGQPAPAPCQANAAASTKGRSAEYANDWAHQASAVDELLVELQRRAAQRQRRQRTARISATTLFVLGVILSIGVWKHHSSSGAATIVVSQPHRQVLPDGTKVELKDKAEISVDFSTSLRRVVLLRGDAYFNVAKNPKRPFVVQVGAMEVRAVGTAFSLNFDQWTTELLVLEGRVAVQKYAASSRASPAGVPAANPEAIAFVDAGNRAIVDASATNVWPISIQEANERLAWRMPQLEFSGTPLVDAIAMLNRYNETKFVITDPSLNRLQVSGFLRVDKTNTFVRLLESNFGLVVERRGPNEIVLRPASQSDRSKQ